MLLSVLVPAYRAELWLKEAVDSILMQDVPAGWEVEVIVGVDGCAATLAVAKMLVGPRVTVLDCKRNKGVYITLNTLIAESNGDAFVAHGADDVIKQKRLEVMLDMLDNRSDVSLVNTFAYKANSDMGNAQKVSRAHDGIWLWRREAWETQIGGYRPWRCGGDSEAHARAKHSGLHLHTVPEHLYIRRVHPEQLTSHPSTRAGAKVREDIIRYIEDQNTRMIGGELPTPVIPVCHRQYTKLEF